MAVRGDATYSHGNPSKEPHSDVYVTHHAGLQVNPAVDVSRPTLPCCSQAWHEIILEALLAIGKDDPTAVAGVAHNRVLVLVTWAATPCCKPNLTSIIVVQPLATKGAMLVGGRLHHTSTRSGS